MTFCTNRTVTGLMNIRIDAEPDVIRRRKNKYLQRSVYPLNRRHPYVDPDDWAYNLDVYNLQYLGDALHYEVHNFFVEEGEW